MSKLYYRYGAMNSGKTTLLLQVAHNYEERGMKVLILKPKNRLPESPINILAGGKLYTK